MFYIVEQGNRVQTPASDLFTRTVSPIDASKKTRPVESDKHPDERDQAGYQSQTGKVRQEAKAVQEAYQQVEQEQPRSTVVFAHQIMTSPVVTAFMDQNIEVTWKLFSECGFHHLPLVDKNNRLCGIVSDRDLLRYAANHGRAIGAIPISQLMTKRVVSTEEDAEIRTIAEVMCGQSIGAVPVVDEALQVTGIVSRSDILRTLVNRAPIELWA